MILFSLRLVVVADDIESKEHNNSKSKPVTVCLPRAINAHPKNNKTGMKGIKTQVMDEQGQANRGEKKDTASRYLP